MNPKDSWVINRRARCYAEIGKREEAINDSNRTLKYNPSNGYLIVYQSQLEKVGIQVHFTKTQFSEEILPEMFHLSAISPTNNFSNGHSH
ncbi:unnamed protein product [Rhizophagus irregularis]|nr:unnamed protein product [Rhizophagus irregularis]